MKEEIMNEYEFVLPKDVEYEELYAIFHYTTNINSEAHNKNYDRLHELIRNEIGFYMKERFEEYFEFKFRKKPTYQDWHNFVLNAGRESFQIQTIPGSRNIINGDKLGFPNYLITSKHGKEMYVNYKNSINRLIVNLLLL